MPTIRCSRRVAPARRQWQWAILTVLLVASCRGQDREFRLVRRSPQQEMLRALQTTDPDVRRQAVVRVAQSDQVSRDWAVQGLSAIARTDLDSQVRCAALSGLRRAGSEESAQALLEILHADQHPNRVTPPAPAVRCAAADALGRMCAADKISDDQRAAACDTLLSLLTSDADRHVRLAAAERLGRFRQPRVLPVLVASLRDGDFGVSYAARKSLLDLTGMEFGYDVSAWQEWLQQTPEPFANARPEPAQPPKRWKLW